MRGYTLLEMLVVMLIFGLLTALVTPQLTRLYERVQISYERQEVLERINGLTFLAFQQGADSLLIKYPVDEESGQSTDPKASDPKSPVLNELLKPIPLELPAGWTLQTEHPIHFLAHGVCQGGTLHLQHPQHPLITLELMPPFCQAHWQPHE